MRAARVSVWGLGPHAVRNILPALTQTAGLTLAGVCSRSADTVRATAGEYGCAAWTDPVAMLADQDVDVVYVATPIGLHYQQGESVLRAGKHLWCEKPLAETYDQVRMLVETSRKSDLTLAEGFMYLYHPHWAKLRELVASPTLGRITDISCTFGIPKLDHPGFRDSADLGGGAFLDVGCYPLSLASELFSAQDGEVAFAQIVTARGAEVDCAGWAVLLYGPDTVVRLNWRVGASYRNEADFWGTEGSLFADRVFSKARDYVPVLRVRDRTGAGFDNTGEASDHFVRMFAAFRALMDDSDSAEAERSAAERRAKLRQLVKDTSRKVTYG